MHEVLTRIAPSPVGQLARAIAVAGRDGPARGLELIEAVVEEGLLDDYVPLHAARGDLCRRLHKTEEALRSFRKALDLAQQEPEQRYFQAEIARLNGGANRASLRVAHDRERERKHGAAPWGVGNFESSAVLPRDRVDD